MKKKNENKDKENECRLGRLNRNRFVKEHVEGVVLVFVPFKVPSRSSMYHGRTGRKE